MDSYSVAQKKNFKRMESKKSHSWLWDSHVSPKNSKWLADNLVNMDQSVKKMLTLIEEDGDSFAKKAEMYYQKRPLLVSHVEEFYRMYRSLAERYDHVTGEVKKIIPSDLQSQGSGISDFGSEPPSSWPSPESKPGRPKSNPRAPGFEFFLGYGGSKEDDSSTLDSECESDDSSVNYEKVAPAIDGDDEEEEVVKEKEKSIKVITFENSEDILARIAGFEDKMRDAREKIELSEEEASRLKIELQKYRSYDVTNSSEVGIQLSHKILVDNSEFEKKHSTLEAELITTKEKLQMSEREITDLRHELENSGSSIQHLQEQLKQAMKETTSWKSKFDKEQREVSKLHDRINRYKANLSDREQEIREIRETISNANQVISEENSQLQAEISNLSKEQTYLQDNLKEWELRCRSLEEEIKRVKAAKTEAEDTLQAEIEQLKVELDTIMMEKGDLNAKTALLLVEVSSRDDQIEHLDQHLKLLHIEHVGLIAITETSHKQLEEVRSEVKQLEEEVEKQREAISEAAEEKREAIRQLCFSLEHYRNGYHRLREAFVGQKRLPVMAV